MHAVRVVKLNVAEKAPVPQVLTARTCQKYWVAGFRVAPLYWVWVRPLADATMLVKAASVATWMVYVAAWVAAAQVNVGLVATLVAPLGGEVRVTVPGAAL